MQKRDTILIVDDAELNRAILGETFREDYIIIEAENGKEALDVIMKKPDRIVAMLLDVIMPVMDGFEVLEHMNADGYMQKFPVFLITAESSGKAIKKGYDMGVVDIINKPFDPYFVRRRIGNVIELYKAREQLNRNVEILEDALEKQRQEIQELNNSTMEALATAIEFRDSESGEHVNRIHDLTYFLLSESDMGAGMSRMQMDQIATAAIMHDVGKIAIPDSVLNKPGRLTAEEYEIMKTHTVKGWEILKSVPKHNNNPVYIYAYDICRHHHERWDGKGYPDGLKGNQISTGAQIVSLADVYDALTSERVYKSAYSHEKAMAMILNGECGIFNPKLLECFVSLSDKIKREFYNKNHPAE